MARRARKGPEGDPCRMPCRVRKEVWLEPPQGLELEKNNPPLFKKNNEKSVGGVFVPQVQNTGYSRISITKTLVLLFYTC